MAENEESSGPSLEPPSLFRRKKKVASPEPAGDETPTTILDDAPAAPSPTPVAPPPLFADEAPTETLEEQAPLKASVAAPTETLEEQAPLKASVAAPTAVSTPPRPAKPPRTGPLLPGRQAPAVAGLLVGGLIVGLTSASFELCSLIQGTNSCGGPGIFLLLAILVLAVVLGTTVLRLCQVSEPGSTSFLAVGLTSVVALLFLVDALFEWWMIIVIPLVSVATFLLSHWVTTTFVEPAAD